MSSSFYSTHLTQSFVGVLGGKEAGYIYHSSHKIFLLLTLFSALPNNKDILLPLWYYHIHINGDRWHDHGQRQRDRRFCPCPAQPVWWNGWRGLMTHPYIQKCSTSISSLPQCGSNSCVNLKWVLYIPTRVLLILYNYNAHLTSISNICKVCWYLQICGM